jgi:hypothetical protein
LLYQSVPSDTPTEEEIVTLFLRAEVSEVVKHYHAKEEIVVKKKTITETKKISEQLRSEIVNVQDATKEEGENEKIQYLNEKAIKIFYHEVLNYSICLKICTINIRNTKEFTIFNSLITMLFTPWELVAD